MGRLSSAMIYFLHNTIHHPEKEITPLKTVCEGEIKKTVKHAILSLYGMRLSVQSIIYNYYIPGTPLPPKSIPRGNATTTTRGKKTKRCAYNSHTDLQSSLHHADAERFLSSVFSVGSILTEQRAQVFVKTLNRGLQVEWQALQRARRSAQKLGTPESVLTCQGNAEVTHSQDTHYLVTPTAFEQRRGHSQSGHTLPGDSHSVRATQRSLTVRIHMTWWCPQCSWQHRGHSQSGHTLPGDTHSVHLGTPESVLTCQGNAQVTHSKNAHYLVTPTPGGVVVVDCFYIALFSALEQTHCAHTRFYMSAQLFYSAFLNIHQSGVLTAQAWLVPQKTAAVSAHSVYTLQPCSMSLHAKLRNATMTTRVSLKHSYRLLQYLHHWYPYTSSFYNCNGWLGVKHQVTCLLHHSTSLCVELWQSPYQEVITHSLQAVLNKLHSWQEVITQTLQAVLKLESSSPGLSSTPGTMVSLLMMMFSGNSGMTFLTALCVPMEKLNWHPATGFSSWLAFFLKHKNPMYIYQS